MLEWAAPRLADGNWVRAIIASTDNMGSDCSFANMYLLRKKYQTELCRYKDFVIRRYHGQGARAGYTFPIGKGDIQKALETISEDAGRRGERLRFAFVTEEQKRLLEEYMPGRFRYSADAKDSDYVYLRRELAELSGRAFHKKKNHFSKFERSYPQYAYVQIGRGNWDDAQNVADRWYYEHGDKADASVRMEYEAVQEALQNFEELELFGGMIYVKERPVAMTVASGINRAAADVHFEKVVGDSAENGGYAAINKLFAAQSAGTEWINREEDLGIEGLRHAKESYHPKMMIKKYSAYEL